MFFIVDFYNVDGILKCIVKYNSQDELFVLIRGVVEELEDSWLSKIEGFGMYNNLFVEVKCLWMEGLKYCVNLGLNYCFIKGGLFIGEGINSIMVDILFIVLLNYLEMINWIVENLLIYDCIFGKYQLNVVGMYFVEQIVYICLDVVGWDIFVEYFQFYNIGCVEGIIMVNFDNWNYQKSGLMFWMGCVMYIYDNCYMLMVIVCVDVFLCLVKGY